MLFRSNQRQGQAEALTNIQEAIREYLAALEERLQDGEIREIEMQV